MSALTSPHSWLFNARPRPGARLRLFCFSHAGGGASSFSSWPVRFPAEIEVCLVQLPGRENRLREKPFQDYAQLLPVLAEALQPFMDLPFAFFGHSMGALLSLGLAWYLRQQGQTLPLHIFASAYRAPQLPHREIALHTLSEPELLSKLRELNGTPVEILDNPELRSIWVPLIRADFGVCETYQHPPGEPLPVPITVLGGSQDTRVTHAMLESWRELTSAPFQLQMLPGDHFYLHNVSKDQVLQLVMRELRLLNADSW